MNAPSFNSYQDEIDYLKYWIEERIKWMDANVLLLSDTLQGDDTAPVRFILRSAYPNPFNPSATIEYNLTVAAHVRMQVFNMRGQLVRTLIDEQQNAGIHTALWNGANDAGAPAASGVYTCRSIVRHLSGSESKTIKMALVR